MRVFDVVDMTGVVGYPQNSTTKTTRPIIKTAAALAPRHVKAIRIDNVADLLAFGALGRGHERGRGCQMWATFAGD